MAAALLLIGATGLCRLLAVVGLNYFHVFVFASHKRKLQWFQKNFPDRMQDAEAELEATDKRREEYVRQFYDQQWDNHRLYHLMINSCMGCEAMVKAATEASGLAQQAPVTVGG